MAADYAAMAASLIGTPRTGFRIQPFDKLRASNDRKHGTGRPASCIMSVVPLSLWMLLGQDTCMSQPCATTILYCHCAYSEAIPDAVKNDVLSGLRHAKAEVHVVADLCLLASQGDELLRRLADDAKAQAKLAIVACSPRAVRALFDAAGASLAGKEVTFLNMRKQGSDEIIDWLKSNVAAVRPFDRLMALSNVEGQAHGPEQSRGTNSAATAVGTPNGDAGETPAPQLPPPAPAKEGNWIPWFPVIDRDLCVNCEKCRKFCLFGVYETKDGKVRVGNPRNCKTNCPACARICPKAAIIFPKYNQAPINGDEATDGDAQPPMQVDHSKVLSGDVYAALQGRQDNAIDASQLMRAIQEHKASSEAATNSAPTTRDSNRK